MFLINGTYYKLFLNTLSALALFAALTVTLFTPVESEAGGAFQRGLPASADWTGRAVSMTPFDLKLMGAGFYEISDARPDATPLTVEQIFGKALTFQYQRDNSDQWQDPDATERMRTGDCEDMAVWLYRELKRNGYQRVRVMVGKFESGEKVHHVWVTLPASSGDDLILDPALQTRVWRRSALLPDLYVPSYSFDGARKYDHTL
jgi:hypothetical protein